ncbi:MAG: VWA domain-containing protein [Phycisphaerae bacterium]|jgi:Ca-activated chloride channel family protein
MTHVHLPLTPEWLLWPYPWVWALLLLPVVPGLWAWWWWRRPRGIRYSDLGALREAGSRWPRRVRGVLPVLRSAALVCLIIAAARPQRPDESSQIYAEGIAIQLVADTSPSMDDVDLSPPGRRMTRLDVVKDVFRRFVMGDGKLPGRPNDLIGLIRFAYYPDTACPLTLDHDGLADTLGELHLSLDRSERGTSIGDALALAVERMKDLERTTGAGETLKITSRIAVLITDGFDETSQIKPQEAGELAAHFGIKVYTILAGTFHGMRPSDDRDLRAIAEVTGGKFYDARNADSLVQIMADIDRLERTRVEERRFVRYGELARPWLMAAMACLCLQMVLAATRLRKIP